MELSSDLPGCCSSSPLVQSSLHSGNSTVSPSSPSISQPQRKVLNSSEDTTWNSVGFIQELHSKLVLVQAQREDQNITRLRRSNRRSFRFSPYGRSRSLCYLSVRSRNLAPRRASQNDSQKFLPIIKSVSSPGVSLKRKFDLVTEHSQVATALTRELSFNAHTFISENTVDIKDFGKRLKQNDGTDVKTIVRSASFRKAESLRKLTQEGRIAEFDGDDQLVPTAPATPSNFATPKRSPSLPFPIISPPQNFAPRLPLTVETTAKIRLGKYKEREGRTADHDYARCQQATNGTYAVRSNLSEDWEILLGLGKQSRKERIDWLLQFVPTKDSYSTSSSFSSTSSSYSFGSRSRFEKSMRGLIDQLATSPETRFHAAWIFLRYHYLLGLNRTRSVTCEQLPLYSSSGVWDVTLASLAISVKFHRDFLYPLIPVEAVDYMQISPHDMEYEEFEYAQRAVLDAFSYELGVTPQPFLDQVWIALPSLRDLLDFDGGWNQVKKETWWMLFNSLYEPDVLKFSVSILTATALSRAVVSVLAQRYHYQSDWNLTCNFARAMESRIWEFRVVQQFRLRAGDDAEGVVMDIQVVLGVSDIQINECRRWFEARSGLV